MVFYRVSHTEKQQAEKAQKNKRIEYLRRFSFAVITNFTVCFVPVVQWKQRLNYSRYPEKLISPEIKRNISQDPISALVR
jgi:hypothetical protein